MLVRFTVLGYTYMCILVCTDHHAPFPMQPCLAQHTGDIRHVDRRCRHLETVALMVGSGNGIRNTTTRRIRDS
jgi:hypothetical protein